jgi:Asp-tRNA(Asn)/Glu-tRNA(Gln) amidotransferase A subunit family amidase
MIVVPMGFGTQGLPMAVVLIARPYQEGQLIGYAYDYEQATKHRRHRPSSRRCPARPLPIARRNRGG